MLPDNSIKLEGDDGLSGGLFIYLNQLLNLVPPSCAALEVKTWNLLELLIQSTFLLFI